MTVGSAFGLPRMQFAVHQHYDSFLLGAKLKRPRQNCFISQKSVYSVGTGEKNSWKCRWYTF